MKGVEKDERCMRLSNVVKTATLLKRFVLLTTEFHQHMAKSTTSY